MGAAGDPERGATVETRGNDPRPDARAGIGPSRWASLPIPLLLAAIVVSRAAGFHGVHESNSLRLALDSTFYTFVAFGTLILIGRSFLAFGKPGLLFLECGVVLWSLAGTVGDAVYGGDANVNITIFNLGIFLAGLCHLTGAALSRRMQRLLRPTPLWLTGGILLALLALGLITWAALTARLPVFFIQGRGGTPLRYAVLIAATAAFALSAVLLRAGARRARPSSPGTASPCSSWRSACSGS